MNLGMSMHGSPYVITELQYWYQKTRKNTR